MSNFVLYELRYNWPTKTAQFRHKKISKGRILKIFFRLYNLESKKAGGLLTIVNPVPHSTLLVKLSRAKAFLYPIKRFFFGPFPEKPSE